jgi:class 3 adenylate cyclase
LISSGACGVDIIFQEEVKRLGGRRYLVLPYHVSDFRKTCLEGFQGKNWSARFNRIREGILKEIILNAECPNDNAVVSEFCNRYMVGYGMRVAHTHSADIQLISLWNGRPGKAIGGTASMLEYCRKNKIPHKVLPVFQARIERNEGLPFASTTLAAIPKPKELKQHIVAVLFADAVKFSRLSDLQLQNFIREFLKPVGQLIAHHREDILVRNSWGDGLFVVFKSVVSAATFARELGQYITNRRFRYLGLPSGFSVRIALHAGPVFAYQDPILKRENYLGSHINQAARLEPVIHPGRVYCSDAFYTLCMAECPSAFTFKPRGEITLAKNFGRHPAFELC